MFDEKARNNNGFTFICTWFLFRLSSIVLPCVIFYWGLTSLRIRRGSRKTAGIQPTRCSYAALPTLSMSLGFEPDVRLFHRLPDYSELPEPFLRRDHARLCNSM